MTKVCLMCGDSFPDATTFCPKDGAALRAAVQGDDLIGEVFCDRYVVTDLLGEGGMGSVYVARDVRLPQQVAIKVLRERAMADPSTVARFRQEAEAASRINHDRVARVTDFGFMEDGRAYLIMEFVKGRTLKQVIAERGRLAPDQAARIAGMVAEGLDAAHRLAIVHRDLKPDNVMVVDDEGGGVRVKVLDFGIAKVLHTEESASRTATGFVIGTPQWMSPEQILGSAVDARSDVYALGLLVYTMLTGKRAFEKGGSPEEEMMVRLAAPPNRLAAVLPSVQWPEGLQALLDRTLSREVESRPASALLFAKELIEITGRESTSVLARDQTPVLPFSEQPTVLSVQAAAPAVAQGSGSLTSASPASASPASASPKSASPIAASPASSRPAPGSSSTRNLVRAAVALAAVVAVFLAVRQWRANAGAAPAASTTLANTQNADSSTAPSAMTGVPNTTAPASDSAGVLPSGNNAANRAGTGQAERPATSPNSSQANSTTPGNSRLPAAAPATPRSAATQTEVNAPTSSGDQALAAHNDLMRVMDDADADVGTRDVDVARAKARETIRKLELLTPKLSAMTDRGNAQLYIGMSQATLGENDKACASVKRAEALAAQSPALQNSVVQWRDLLKCSM